MSRLLGKVVAVGFDGEMGAGPKCTINVDGGHRTRVGVELSGSPGECGSWSGDWEESITRAFLRSSATESILRRCSSRTGFVRMLA